MTQFYIKDGDEYDAKPRPIEEGVQLHVHSYGLHKSDPAACVYSTVTEHEYTSIPEVVMRTLVGRADGKNQSWADYITMLYLSSIVVERIREGWTLNQAGGLIVYLSKRIDA